MDQQTSSTSGGSSNGLEEILEKFFSKAPALPNNVKEVIVSLTPWVTLIILVLALPALLLAFGISSFLLPFAVVAGATAGFGWLVSIIFGIGLLLLELIALPGLFARKRSAWKILFWVALLTALESLLRLQIISLIIGSLVSFYFLFQIKSYYK
jgi:hypothetical protein